MLPAGIAAETAPNTRVIDCVKASKQWLRTVWQDQTVETLYTKLAHCIQYPITYYREPKFLEKIVRELNPHYIETSDSHTLNLFATQCIDLCDKNNLASDYQKKAYILCAFVQGTYFLIDPLKKSISDCFKETTTDNDLQDALVILLAPLKGEK